MRRELKINGGMLPQFRPIETRITDRYERNWSRYKAFRSSPCGTAATQQSREVSLTDTGVKPSSAFAECGVRRVFVLDKSDNFHIQTNKETVQGRLWKYCNPMSHQHGYNFVYALQGANRVSSLASRELFPLGDVG